jgi:hypothetical protein
VGFDVHITRVTFWPYSQRYPIRTSEWLAVVARNDDLVFEADRYPEITDDPDASYTFTWIPSDGIGSWFSWHLGEIKTKNPADATIRRMIEIAAELDAWVVGDDTWIYDLDCDGLVVPRNPTRIEIHELIPHFITRGTGTGGMNRSHPIMEAEWLDLVARQPDFLIATEVEAHVPSGHKHIPCPPVAIWTHHPSRPEIPFFFDTDLIEVNAADTTTLARMKELASALDAKVLDGNDEALDR